MKNYSKLNYETRTRIWNLAVGLKEYSNTLFEMIEQDSSSDDILNFTRYNLQDIIDDINAGFYTEKEVLL